MKFAHIDGAAHAMYETIHALPAEYKCVQSNKGPVNPFTNVC